MVVFLLQGYLSSGSEALLKTLAISGPIALVDCAIKAALLHYGVSLFLYWYVMVWGNAHHVPVDTLLVQIKHTHAGTHVHI